MEKMLGIWYIIYGFFYRLFTRKERYCYVVEKSFADVELPPAFVLGVYSNEKSAVVATKEAAKSAINYWNRPLLFRVVERVIDQDMEWGNIVYNEKVFDFKTNP